MNKRIMLILSALPVFLLYENANSVDLAEYFPISPGRSWQFTVRKYNKDGAQTGSWQTKRVMQSYEFFNGVKVVPQAYYDSDYGNMNLIDDRDFFSLDSNLVYLHGHEQVGNPSWNNEEPGKYMLSPSMTFKRHMDIGESWTDTTTVIDPSGGRHAFSSTLTVAGFEDITVPAGKFSDCLKIRSSDTDESGEIELWWWAEGVGVVKTIEYQTDSEQEVSELTSYAIEGVSYPETAREVGPWLYILLGD